MDREIWERYWNDETNHAWWERPAPEVVKLIWSQSPKTRPAAFDLGCGFGRHAIAFAIAGYKVAATDASQRAIAHLRD